MTPPIRGLRYPSARPLLDGEHKYMEYFQVVCAGEFSLFFEHPPWENIIIQGTLAEPALHYAALAIGALARSRYHPELWQRSQAIVFSIKYYSLAIQDLCCRFDGSSQSLVVGVLASVVFSYIEFLIGLEIRVEMHVQAGCALLGNLYTKINRTLAVSSQARSNCQVGPTSPEYDLLARAMSQLTAQVNCSTIFWPKSNE